MSGWTEEQMRRRKQQDADMIADIDRWPDVELMLKTQPWITESERNMSFASIHFMKPLVVRPEHGPEQVYKSAAEIAERWSVD